MQQSFIVIMWEAKCFDRFLSSISAHLSLSTSQILWNSFELFCEEFFSFYVKIFFLQHFCDFCCCMNECCSSSSTTTMSVVAIANYVVVVKTLNGFMCFSMNVLMCEMVLDSMQSLLDLVQQVLDWLIKKRVCWFSYRKCILVCMFVCCCCIGFAWVGACWEEELWIISCVF